MHYVKILFKSGKRERLYFDEEKDAVQIIRTWVEAVEKGTKGVIRSDNMYYGFLIEDISSMILYEESDDEDDDGEDEDLSPWEKLERSME